MWGQNPTLLVFFTQAVWLGYTCPDTSLLGLMVWGRNTLWSFRWDKALVCSYRSPHIDPTALAPLQLLFYHLWAPYISLKPMCNSLGIQKCAKLLCKDECIIELWLICRDSKSLCLSCLSPLDEPHQSWQTEAQSKKVRCTRSWKERIMGLCANAPKHDL